jgi:hypothetical protein
MLLLVRDLGETLQRITSALKASSPEFQAWLRYKNVTGSDIYIGMNPLRKHALTRTKKDIKSIRHVYLDLDHGGQELSPSAKLLNSLPRPAVAASPIRALGTGLALRVVDTLFVGTANDAIRNDDGFDLVRLYECD